MTLQLYRRLRDQQGYGSGQEIDILEWTGHLDEARRLASAALAKARAWGDSEETLGTLARLAARQGKRAEALRYDQLLASRGEPPYGRATIASLLGDREGAVRLLEEARARGRQYWLASAWNVHNDPSFAALRDYPPYQRFLRPRG